MHCLTICQPWATLIVYGRKTVENRTWSTRYRGPLLIHAGKSQSWMHAAIEHASLLQAGDLPFGAIIGRVELVDCVPFEESSLFPSGLQDNPFASGPYCWLLSNPVIYRPFTCSGAQGLWTPPTDFHPEPI